MEHESFVEYQLVLPAALGDFGLKFHSIVENGEQFEDNKRFQEIAGIPVSFVDIRYKYYILGNPFVLLMPELPPVQISQEVKAKLEKTARKNKLGTKVAHLWWLNSEEEVEVFLDGLCKCSKDRGCVCTCNGCKTTGECEYLSNYSLECACGEHQWCDRCEDTTRLWNHLDHECDHGECCKRGHTMARISKQELLKQCTRPLIKSNWINNFASKVSIRTQPKEDIEEEYFWLSKRYEVIETSV